MILLRALGLLLLLVSGQTSLAYTHSFQDETGKSGFSAEVLEFGADTDWISDFTVTPTGPFGQIHLPASTFQDFRFCSVYESLVAESYLKYSQNIIPGLDGADIAYPFHFFL